MNTIVNLLFPNSLGILLVTLLLVSAVVFLITNLLPGDPVQEMLGQAALGRWWRPCGQSWVSTSQLISVAELAWITTR